MPLRTIIGPLERTSDFAAARHRVTIAREETPGPCSTAPIRSVWPTNPAGKPLTNARIRAYQLAGRYGEEAQRAAQARLTAAQAAKRRKRERAKFERLVAAKYLDL